MSEVKIFSSEGCLPCKLAKRDLEEENISYDVVDVGSAEGRRKMREENVKSLPTFKVEGDRIVGYSEETVEEIKSKVRDDV